MAPTAQTTTQTAPQAAPPALVEPQPLAQPPAEEIDFARIRRNALRHLREALLDLSRAYMHLGRLHTALGVLEDYLPADELTEWGSVEYFPVAEDVFAVRWEVSRALNTLSSEMMTSDLARLRTRLGDEGTAAPL